MLIDYDAPSFADEILPIVQGDTMALFGLEDNPVVFEIPNRNDVLIAIDFCLKSFDKAESMIAQGSFVVSSYDAVLIRQEIDRTSFEFTSDKLIFRVQDKATGSDIQLCIFKTPRAIGALHNAFQVNHFE